MAPPQAESGTSPASGYPQKGFSGQEGLQLEAPDSMKMKHHSAELPPVTPGEVQTENGQYYDQRNGVPQNADDAADGRQSAFQQGETESLMKFSEAHARRLASGITSVTAHHHLLVEEKTRALHTTLPWLVPCVGARVTPQKSWSVKNRSNGEVLYEATEVDPSEVDLEGGSSDKAVYGSWRSLGIHVRDAHGHPIFSVSRPRSFLKVTVPLVWPYSPSLQGSRAMVTAADGSVVGYMMSVPPNLWPLVDLPWKAALCGFFITLMLVFFRLVFPPLQSNSMNSFIEVGVIIASILVACALVIAMVRVWVAGYQRAMFNNEGKEIARLVKAPRLLYYIPLLGMLVSRPYDIEVVDGTSAQYATARYHQYSLVDSRRKLPKGMPAYQAWDLNYSRTGRGATVEVRVMMMAAFFMRSYYPDYPLPLYHLGWLLPPLCLCFL